MTSSSLVVVILFEISDDESVPDSKAAQNKKGGNRTAAKAAALPMIVEGEKDLAGAVAKYKKALLNKRTVLKEVKDRLEAEQCTTCKPLVTLHIKHCLVLVCTCALQLASVACCCVPNRGTI